MASNKVHVTTVAAIPGNKRATFNLDFARDNDVSAAVLDEVLAAAKTYIQLSTGLKSVFPSSLSWVQVEAYAWDFAAHSPQPPDFERQVMVPERVTSFSTAGTHSGTGAPPQVSIAASFKTATAGRRGRGRIYTPAPVQAVVTAEGTLDSSHRANLESKIQAYIDAIESAPTTGGALTHVVASMMAGSAYTVNSVVVHNRVDTQRRRLNRGLDV